MATKRKIKSAANVEAKLEVESKVYRTKVKTKYDAMVLLGFIKADQEPRDLSFAHLKASQAFDEERYPKFIWDEAPEGSPQGIPTRRNYRATTQSADALADLLGARSMYSVDGIPVLRFPNGFEVHAGRLGETYNDARDAQKARMIGWNQVGPSSHKNQTDPQTLAPDIITLKFVAQQAEMVEGDFPKLTKEAQEG